MIYLIFAILLIPLFAIGLLDYLLAKSETNKQKLWTYRVIAQSAGTIIVLAIVWCFFLYPGFYSLRAVFSAELKEGKIPNFAINHFVKTSERFTKWANQYIASRHAANIDHEDIAATEWPMFGSVFYLLTAEEIHERLQKQAGADADKQRHVILEASKSAAQIIVDPATGTWVKKKWGDSYRSEKNLFYRMLLIMGLTSYEKMSSDKQYRDILKTQVNTLGRELTVAKTHLLDDYPGECYPNDVLWAAAAILRADKLLKTDHVELKKAVMKTLDSATLTKKGMPAYAVDSGTGFPVSEARGCANSGILNFAPELDLEIAEKWYANYVKSYWKEKRFLVGFREFTSDYPNPRQNVDSGPIVAGYGSVASLFGIGAARGVGRLDHAVPLTLETIAMAWPTPFGFMLPNIMAHLCANAAPLGETTILFQMTRPILPENKTPYRSSVPFVVWMMVLIYFGFALIICYLHYRSWRNMFKRKPGRIIQST